jgi:hypothetical protein
MEWHPRECNARARKTEHGSADGIVEYTTDLLIAVAYLTSFIGTIHLTSNRTPRQHHEHVGGVNPSANSGSAFAMQGRSESFIDGALNSLW